MEKLIIKQTTGISSNLHSDDFGHEEPPIIFWKYYDLYRRGMITINDFVSLSGISTSLLSIYLRIIETFALTYVTRCSH